MIIELVQNIALLVVLAVGLELLARRLARRSISYRIAAGALYGGVCVAVMMTPMQFAPGVIYDGRSIVLSLAGLFGGPLPAGIAAAISGAYRIYLGGAGMLPGILTILEASGLGVGMYYLRRRDDRWGGLWRLWLFALVVHTLMLALQLLLPAGAGWRVLREVGPAVLVLFPIGFLLVAQVLLEVERRQSAEESLRASEALQQAMIECSPLALYSIDTNGNVIAWNESAERIFGWRAEEVLGKPLPIVPEERQEEFAALRRRALEGESFTGVELTRQRRDGSLFVGSLAVAPLLDAGGRCVGVFGAMEDVTDKKQAERALRENEEQFRTLVEGAPDAIFVQTDMKFAYANAATVELFGVSSPDELVGRSVLDRFGPSVRDLVRRRIEMVNTHKQRVPAVEEVCLGADGREIPVEVSAVPTVYHGKAGAIVFARDISNRKRLEKQLVQAQKMEAIGRLAGGVAHDFNNMLQAILGYTDMLLFEVEDESPVRGRLEEIHKAALRSADLTRQLLAFARKQTIAPRVLDLNETVSDMLKMLQRLIGEDIDLLWRPCEGRSLVNIDPAQVDQILANLVVNARDAITGVGRITIETAHLTVDEEYCTRHPEWRPGRYETLTISDDGAGMDRETVAQAFEPFFTTKADDQGTGLGLATVYGIVKQNHGFINIYSEPGQGTSVRIHLSSAADQEASQVDSEAKDDIPGGSETILLVEDEPALLELNRQLLTQLGYTVLPAGGADEALRIAEDQVGGIEVLVTDVIMPRMSGRDLFTRLNELRPGLKCLFMSGYTDNVIAHHGVLEKGVHFLQKPFARAALARKLRAVIEA